MERIRVVFAIGALHGGGSERQLVSLLRTIDRTQFQPFLYLVYRSGPLLSLVPPDVPVMSFEERVTDSRLYLPGLMHQRRVRDYAACLRQIHADVSYDRTFLMTLIAAAGAQRAGVPNVSTIVTDPETGFAPVAGRFQWAKRRMLRRLYDRSDRVLAVSEGAAKSAVRFYGINPRNVRTLTNGVDLRLLEEQSTTTIDHPWWLLQDVPPDRSALIVRLVTAGRLNEQKGFHFLIEALAELKHRFPNVGFRLAILGEGLWRSRLQELISGLHLTEEVRLPGFISDAAAWYRAADLFVLPSLMEGMPNVLLEAMALGIPVIATDCPSGPRELLQSGKLGRLVIPGSVDALVVAMEEFLLNRRQAAAVAGDAREIVNVEHSIDTSCRQLEQLLKEVVTCRRIGTFANGNAGP